jgi:hypothetical protein
MAEPGTSKISGHKDYQAVQYGGEGARRGVKLVQAKGDFGSSVGARIAIAVEHRIPSGNVGISRVGLHLDDLDVHVGTAASGFPETKPKFGIQHARACGGSSAFGKSVHNPLAIRMEDSSSRVLSGVLQVANKTIEFSRRCVLNRSGQGTDQARDDAQLGSAAS